jgi:hypothetical protein
MLKLVLYSVCSVKIYNTKLKTAAIEQQRCLVYTSEIEKGVIHAYDLKEKKSAGFLKISNARVNRMVIESIM